MKQLRSEWIKLRTVISNKVLGVVAVLAGVGFGTLASLVVPHDQTGNVDSTYSLATAGFGLAALLIGVVGILAITQEFRFTARTTFTIEPRRPRVMAWKAVLVLLVGGVLAGVIVPVAVLFNGTLLRTRDMGFDYGGHGFWRAVLGSIVVMAVTALAGLGIGAIIRSPAFAITAFVLWNIVVEPLVAGLVPKVGRWFPFTAGSLVAQLSPDTSGGGPTSVWLGFGLFAAFALVLVVIGTVLITVRDA